MKKVIFTIAFFTALILFEVKVLQAQWQPDIRLTNDPSSSYTSNNNAWCIASSGDEVHIVLRDNRDGNYEIYYKHSTDEGINWGSDTRLTTNSALSLSPSVAVSNSVVHVVWSDTRDGHVELYYKRSTDGGTSWGPDTRLTTTEFGGGNCPSVSLSGSVVHVVFEDSRNGHDDIYYKRTTDGGLSWGSDIRLTYDLSSSRYPSVCSYGSVVHVVWYDDRNSPEEIYYKRSPDGGLNWGSDIRLTTNSFYSLYPSVAVSGQVVHVVWHEENMNGNYEIFYKRSANGGLSWGSDTRLTFNSALSLSPSVTAPGQIVHVVWTDNRDGNTELYYKHSQDGGISWGPDTRLTNSPGSSSGASVLASDSVAHVVWTDGRDGNLEIYYKRDPTGNTLPPSAPFNLSALAVSSSRINLNWTDTSSMETGFKIERSINAGANWILKDSVALNICTYADTGLAVNTIYHYRVCAYNAAGISPYSNTAFDTTFIAVPLSPTLLSPPNGATGQSLTPTLVWGGVIGATSYRLQVSTDSIFSTTLINDSTLITTYYTVQSGLLQNNTLYFWRVNAKNAGGSGPWSAIWNFRTLIAGISMISSEVPKEYKLYINYPNPFNPLTKIRFDIPRTTKVKIIIYDLIGREAELLYDDVLYPGKFEIIWNAKDYPSGVYFYRIISNEFVEAKKMILIK